MNGGPHPTGPLGRTRYNHVREFRRACHSRTCGHRCFSHRNHTGRAQPGENTPRRAFPDEPRRAPTRDHAPSPRPGGHPHCSSHRAGPTSHRLNFQAASQPRKGPLWWGSLSRVWGFVFPPTGGQTRARSLRSKLQCLGCAEAPLPASPAGSQGPPPVGFLFGGGDVRSS